MTRRQMESDGGETSRDVLRLTIQFVLGERGFTQVPDTVRSWSLGRGWAKVGHRIRKDRQY